LRSSRAFIINSVNHIFIKVYAGCIEGASVWGCPLITSTDFFELKEVLVIVGITLGLLSCWLPSCSPLNLTLHWRRARIRSILISTADWILIKPLLGVIFWHSPLGLLGGRLWSTIGTISDLLDISNDDIPLLFLLLLELLEHLELLFLVQLGTKVIRVDSIRSHHAELLGIEAELDIRSLCC
jgi:hypothetical protein